MKRKMTAINRAPELVSSEQEDDPKLYRHFSRVYIKRRAPNPSSSSGPTMENVASGLKNFALQWRDLAGSIDSSRNALKARLEELQQHFESEQSLIQSRRQKIRDREKEMEANVSNLKSELHKVESLIEEKGKEVGVKERRLVEVEKLLEENERGCNFINKCIEERSEKLNKCNEEIELKLAQLNAIRGSIEQAKQEQGKVEDFAVLKKSMEEWSSKLGVKERELEGWVEKLEFREKQVESMLEEIRMIDKRASECLNEVQLKEQHFDSLGKLIQEQKCHLDSQESSFQERSHGLAMKEKDLEQHAKELDLKQEEFLSAINSMEEQIENLKSKGNTFAHSEVETDQHVLSTPANIVNVANAATSSSPNLQQISIKSKRNLQCPPTELLSENHTMQNKMLLALPLSSDPEKLVLKLMQLSFANFWRKGDVGFNPDFMKKSISMLKDLRKVLPHVGTHVRDDAIRLAVQWKAKMRAETENSLEILCFLHFTATYGCLSTLSEDEIFKFLEMICQHKEARELCQTLGLADKIAGLVQTLIEKKRLIMAVGFICSFNLIEKFPPVHLLKRCVEDARKCKSTIWQNNKSLDEKDEIVDNLIANLRDVIQCIKENELESEIASKDVETEIVGLQKLKENWRCSVPSVASEVEQQEKVKGKSLVRSKAFNTPPELLRRSKRLKPPSELL